jgi:hypothetical protein
VKAGMVVRACDRSDRLLSERFGAVG